MAYSNTAKRDRVSRKNWHNEIIFHKTGLVVFNMSIVLTCGFIGFLHSAVAGLPPQLKRNCVLKLPDSWSFRSQFLALWLVTTIGPTTKIIFWCLCLLCTCFVSFGTSVFIRSAAAILGWRCCLWFVKTGLKLHIPFCSVNFKWQVRKSGRFLWRLGMFCVNKFAFNVTSFFWYNYRTKERKTGAGPAKSWINRPLFNTESPNFTWTSMIHADLVNSHIR